MNPRMRGITHLIVSITVFMVSSQLFPQEKNVRSKDVLTEELRAAIIDKITEVFSESYPLLDVAFEMTNYIAEKNKKGEYDEIKEIKEFASNLTKDLRAKSNDDHIRVMPYEKLPDDLQDEMRLGSPYKNYGFHKVERLLGNIGYLDLRSFNNPKTAGPTAIAAMNFLANCDAFIIDLRYNGGGDTEMGQFISSYFFDEEIHLTSNYIRKDDITEQVWLHWVPGPCMPEIPLYILMHRMTYSAAEEFAYSLQQSGRAVLIGDKTRGGAHGVCYKSFPDLSINLRVPYSATVNPYSNANYLEGVIPDINVVARKALLTANVEAAKKLLENETDPEKRFVLDWVRTQYEAEINPIILDTVLVSEYVGTFGNVQITSTGESLYLQRGDWEKQELLPMGNDLFKFKDPKEVHYRVQFYRDSHNNVEGLYDLDSDGDKYPPKEKNK